MDQQSNSRIWLIVIGLSVGPLVSVGFARFAYGLMLPAMQEDLAWSFTAAGWISTANAIGYLVGAIVALKCIPMFGAGRVFNLGMVVTALSILASGLTGDLLLLTIFRIFAGVGGAPVFIAGGVLASALFANDPERNALSIAVYFGGTGIGMLLAGLGIPLVLEYWGATAWPHTWLGLGIASLIGLFVTFWSVKAVDDAPQAKPSNEHHNDIPMSRVMPGLVAYFLFGVGYFVYMTFLVAWMRAAGEGVGLVVSTWSALSIMVVFAPFIWRRVLALSNGGGAMALAMIAIGLATLSPMLFRGATGMLLSAVLFGAAFSMIPTAVTSFIKKNYPQQGWGKAVSLFTVFFATGQIIGPTAAGFVADRTASLVPGMAAAGGVLLCGSVFAWLQKPLHAFIGNTK